jgi:hypothetical protein
MTIATIVPSGEIQAIAANAIITITQGGMRSRCRGTQRCTTSTRMRGAGSD